MHNESITIPSLQRGAVLPLAKTYFRQTFLSNYTSKPLDIWYVASVRDPLLHLLNSEEEQEICKGEVHAVLYR